MDKIQPLPETPIVKICNLYLKREDQNPSGSVKDRAIIRQIEKAVEKGFGKAAISSSGNAAISLAYWARKTPLKTSVFLSPKTNRKKIERLERLDSKIVFSQKPIRDCFHYCQKNSAYNMRQSLDPEAIKGFSLLGEEIKKQLKSKNLNPKAIFFPVSSGTTLLGTGSVLAKMKIASFAVQPANHCPLSSLFDSDFQPEEKVIADGLVAKVIPKKKEITNLLKNSGGSGLVVQNSRIIEASNLLRSEGVVTSYEGALAVAGAQKAIEKKMFSESDKLLILLTGKYYEN